MCGREDLTRSPAELQEVFDHHVTVTTVPAAAMKRFNHTTSQSIDLTGVTFINNGRSSVGWNLTGVTLPDGRYTAELPATATTAGLAQSRAFEFHKLAGDVAGNVVVSFDDDTAVNANFAANLAPPQSAQHFVPKSGVTACFRVLAR